MRIYWPTVLYFCGVLAGSIAALVLPIFVIVWALGDDVWAGFFALSWIWTAVFLGPLVLRQFIPGGEPLTRFVIVLMSVLWGVAMVSTFVMSRAITSHYESLAVEEQYRGPAVRRRVIPPEEVEARRKFELQKRRQDGIEQEMRRRGVD